MRGVGATRGAASASLMVPGVTTLMLQGGVNEVAKRSVRARVRSVFGCCKTEQLRKRVSISRSAMVVVTVVPTTGRTMAMATTIVRTAGTTTDITLRPTGTTESYRYYGKRRYYKKRRYYGKRKLLQEAPVLRQAPYYKKRRYYVKRKRRGSIGATTVTGRPERRKLRHLVRANV